MASDSDNSEDFMMEDDDFESDDSDTEMVVKPPPKGRVLGNSGNAKPKATVKKSTASNARPTATTATQPARKKKTVEETYQKVSQIEHILLRPDTYIGSLQPLTEKMFVLEEQSEKIMQREITYTPGLLKIYDEILVNAADNKQRDPNMSKIEIVIEPENNLISVKNNGKGIPVVMHKQHGVYVPTMIFGQLLTGSNFDDEEKKTTGGRNGYGAKLANVFSTEFVIECVDSENKLKFHQVFQDNMHTALEPKVSKATAAEVKQGDYVKISFRPDLKRFNMDRLDRDTVALLARRAYDIAGTLARSEGKTLQVMLNGKKLQIKNFSSYIDLYQGIGKPVAFLADGRWEVGIGLSSEGVQQQISFVNAIATSKGGRHVKYIEGLIADHLLKVISKKNKKTTVKKAQITNHLTIVVNCLIENPSFDSQTKDSLNTQVKSFGSTFTCTSTFLKKIEKSEIVDAILQFAMFKDKQALKKKGGTKKKKLTGISKLDDANNAGSAKSIDCTLIITEGDSAKSLAVAGLSVVGRDFYGVFPLKGKPLNVRDSKVSDVIKNEEIKNLVDIMGLNYGTVYDEKNIKTLRYGHLAIMADQDTDGSHRFLQQFITPIVKVTKNKKSLTFFTVPEYENWLESTGNNGKGFKIKYYKGLGTSTSAEGKEYFSHLGSHLIDFGCIREDTIEADGSDQTLPDNVGSGADVSSTGRRILVSHSGSRFVRQMIDMVFRKDRVEDRKTWLSNVQDGVFMDYKAAAKAGVRYSDFFNKEFILFSSYDTRRSIPNMVDGLKPSQRKVLYGCFKKKLLTSEIKVAQLVGYIAEHSAYHHGELSLQTTIVNMAQNFVGSNNVNLLTPAGQFGTRRMGGKDAASARYIFTKLEPIARAIFHPDDDPLLNYLNDDGNMIEPEYYVPVIPMILVNGADGIGTGWSSAVSNFNPREIIANIRRKIANETTKAMDPFYCGFTGEIKKETKDKYSVRGKIDRIDDTTLRITELPLKKWTQNYKEFLENMMVADPKKPEKPAEIKDFKENHTETTVDFTITAEKDLIDQFEKDPKGLFGKFKLQSSLSTSNMTLFDANGKIIKYDSPEAILDAFYDIRLDFYGKRKENLIKILSAEKLMLSNKARFVEEVCDGSLVVNNRRKKDLLQDLKDRKYDLILKDQKNDDENDGDSSDEEGENSIKELSQGYEYLLGMKIWSLTFEKAQELRRKLSEKSEELESLRETQPSHLWLKDLDAIVDLLDTRDLAIQADKDDELRALNKNKLFRKKVTKKKKPKKPEWDCDMDEESDDEFVARETKTKKKAPVGTKKIEARVKEPSSEKDIILLNDSSDEDFSEPLAQRLQKNLKIAASSSFEKKRPSPRSDNTSDEDLEFDTSNKPVARSTKPPASKKVRAGATKKKTKKSITSDDDNVVPEVRKVQAKSRKKTGLTAAFNKDDSEDSEIDLDDESDGALASFVTSEQPRSRSGRTASKAVYVFSDEDESDGSYSD